MVRLRVPRGCRGLRRIMFAGYDERTVMGRVLPYRATGAWLGLALALLALASAFEPALAHGIGGKDAAFVAATKEADILPFMYLGAKHMLTGYDHLLFLVGVIFFLYRHARHRALRDAVLDRPQHHAAGRRADGDQCQRLSGRRDHRPVGRLQGVRQSGRLQDGVRRAAGQQARRVRASASSTASASRPSCRRST